jgi:uncharacterized MnhB-related membrane protein
MAQTTTTSSGQFSLNYKDLLKGLVLAVISAVLTALLPLLQAGDFKLNWALIGTVAATTAVSYLLKNFFQPPTVIIENPPKSVVDAVKNDEAEIKVVPK